MNIYCFTIGKSTKTHMYWSMKNCGGDGKQLRSDILNVVKHYQVSRLYMYVLGRVSGVSV